METFSLDFEHLIPAVKESGQMAQQQGTPRQQIQGAINLQELATTGRGSLTSVLVW